MALLTAAQVKSRVGAKASKWNDDRITELVARFEALLGEHLGIHLSRERADVIVRSRGGDLLLPDVDVTEITELSVDDVALTEGEIADLDLDSGPGVIRGFNRSGRVVVTYTAGEENAPQAAVDACVAFVKAKIAADLSEKNPQIEEFQDASGYTYTVGRADPANGRYTGINAVDDALAELASNRRPWVA